MIRLFSLLNLSLGLVLLAGCSKAPGRPGLKGEPSADSNPDSGDLPSAQVPDGVEKDPFKEPEKLSLTALNSDEDVAKSFDFTKPTEAHWSSAHEVVLSHGDGQTLSYDFQGKTWTAVHSNQLSTEFQTMFDFRDSGFFAMSADGLSLRADDGKIIQLKVPDDFSEKSIVGTNPGFLAYYAGDFLKIVLSTKDAARFLLAEKAPKGLKLVYPCNLHCIAWGWDGSLISVFFEKDGWKKLDQAIALPAGEEVSRMALRFRAENNPLAVEAALVQTVSGKILAQVTNSAPKADLKWDDVLVMSRLYCVSCHLEDGFDKETTWTGLKSSIVERLKAAPGTKGSMPPAETKLGQQMSAPERAAVLAWIEKQKQTERGEVGTGGSGDKDNVKISGNLKTLAEAHCTSCHADATTNGWWKSRKGNVVSLVNSGKMPKNKALSNELKMQFEAAMKGL